LPSALSRGLSGGLSKGSLVRESFNDLIAMACTGAGGSLDGEFDLEAHLAAAARPLSGAGLEHGSPSPDSPAAQWAHDRRARRNHLGFVLAQQARSGGAGRPNPGGFGLGPTSRRASSLASAASTSTFSVGGGGGGSGRAVGGSSSRQYRKTSDDFEDGCAGLIDRADGCRAAPRDRKSSSRGSEELYDDFDDDFDYSRSHGYDGPQDELPDGEPEDDEEGLDSAGSSSGSFDGSGSFDESGSLNGEPPAPGRGASVSATSGHDPRGSSESRALVGGATDSGHRRYSSSSSSVECDAEALGLFGPSYAAMMAQGSSSPSPTPPALAHRKSAAVATTADAVTTVTTGRSAASSQRAHDGPGLPADRASLASTSSHNCSSHNCSSDNGSSNNGSSNSSSSNNSSSDSDSSGGARRGAALATAPAAIGLGGSSGVLKRLKSNAGAGGW
jgi:hypothetical protein